MQRRSGAAIITGTVRGRRFRDADLPPPGKQHALRHVVAVRHFRHPRARLEVFGFPPGSASSRRATIAADARQRPELRPASELTLRLALRSDAERSAIEAARRPSPDAHHPKRTKSESATSRLENPYGSLS